MKRGRDIWIVGGDRRQLVLAELLEQAGDQVTLVGLGEESTRSLEGVRRADCVLLPIPPADGEGEVPAPFSQRRVRLEELLELLTPGQLVCAGGSHPRLTAQAERRGFRLVNYLEREELAWANAVPTAEGALRVAMEELDVTVCGCPTLVIGYGRVGRTMAERLRALQGSVTVAARSWTGQAQAASSGCQAVGMEELGQAAEGARLIISTVPAVVLTKEILARLRQDCLVIDLASRPGSVDWASAKALGVKAVAALGLPGRQAPRTAGENLRQTVEHIMGECGI